MSDNNCPECGKISIRSCRCMRSDSECESGHQWHYCVVHHITVPGHSSHSLDGTVCTCPGGTYGKKAGECGDLEKPGASKEKSEKELFSEILKSLATIEVGVTELMNRTKKLRREMETQRDVNRILLNSSEKPHE